MACIALCEPTELYNLLNRCSDYPNVSDPEYVLLLDARDSRAYDLDHVITAKHVKKSDDGFRLPVGINLETKLNCIVYDGKTSLLTESSPAVECAQLLSVNGVQDPVKVLRGGYEKFTALYPFLRTQKVSFTPRELDNFQVHPVEILPELVYLGTSKQAANHTMMSKMKIGAFLSCLSSKETKRSRHTEFFIEIEDSNDADISQYFEKASDFIDNHLQQGRRVLLCGDYGWSRSAAMLLAFLIRYKKWTFQDAHSHVMNCTPYIKPNQGFIRQLSEWEKRCLEPETNP
ncbi:serine/threonine/tyrosine-interacting-like protein 1 [Oscarella lobularis]|uniref:serine/threonine/tyrosine-interacting-like protein 1 n=1 Tax=Oscarella lobularis TaxID=121494 RepID=UPI00331358B4